MVKKLQARGEPRKGRGFGFVTLGSEELQQKACSEMNGKEIEGREIAVKVAIDSPGKEDDHEGEAPTTEAVTTNQTADKVVDTPAPTTTPAGSAPAAASDSAAATTTPAAPTTAPAASTPAASTPAATSTPAETKPSA